MDGFARLKKAETCPEGGLVSRICLRASLVFSIRGVYAQPFDPATGKLTGETTHLSGGWNYSVSGSGVLAVQGGMPFGRLIWFDRSENPLGRVGPAALYLPARISPHGKRALADFLAIGSPFPDLRSYPVSGGPGTRLTFGPGFKAYSVWSPDGKYIAYSCRQGGEWDICRKAADGSGTAEKLITLGADIPLPRAVDWSPDGGIFPLTHTSPKLRATRFGFCLSLETASRFSLPPATPTSWAAFFLPTATGSPIPPLKLEVLRFMWSHFRGPAASFKSPKTVTGIPGGTGRVISIS